MTRKIRTPEDEAALPTVATSAVIAKTLNEKFGDGTVVRAGEMLHQVIPRVTTGILSLDVALGGGYALNQWHEVYGEESTGKTATVLQTIAANQMRDPLWEVLWVAAEEFVPEYAAMAGCDLERIILVDTNVMEEALQAVLDYLEGRAVDCVVIDSLASLVPSEEGVKTMDDLQVALGARINGKFFRKSRRAGKRSLTVADRLFLGLLINQPRVDVGGWAPHGRTPMTTPGGRAKNFAAFSRIELRRDEWIEDSKVKVGQTIKARIIKNKSGPPQKIAEWDFYFADHADILAGRIDRVKDVFTTGVATGILVRKGAFYNYGGHKWQGKAATFQALIDDEDLAGSIEDDIRDFIIGQKKGRA